LRCLLQSAFISGDQLVPGGIGFRINSAARLIAIVLVAMFNSAYHTILVLVAVIPAMLALPYHVRERHGSWAKLFAHLPGMAGRWLTRAWRDGRRRIGGGAQPDAAPAE
jgi:hypothetical protein